MISATPQGFFTKTKAHLKAMTNVDISSILHSCGLDGVAALSSATPINSGLVATSWSYEVLKTRTGWELIWKNADIESGFPVAIMLQYGYATGTGGYVQGVNYINPAIKPIFDKIADRVWKAVTSV